MVDWIVKRVVCKKINKLLSAYKGNVDSLRETLDRWIGRLEKLIACLRSLLGKIDDGEITPDEVKEAANEINGLVRGW